jgi:DNA-binding NarL/FixJ family response regulator
MNATRFSNTFSAVPPSGGVPSDATICFVGALTQFPDTVLRTVQTELCPAQIFRFLTMGALHANEEALPPLSAVIVDEANAEDLIAACAEKAPELAGAHPVIAYLNAAAAIDLIQNQSDAICTHAISLLPMNLNLETWLSVMRMALSGGHYVPPELLTRRSGRGVSGYAMPSPGHMNALTGIDGAGLTPREIEVLTMVALGQPNKAIASELTLSEHTVKLHIHRVIAKLGVKNRTEAAVLFHRHHGD